MRKEYNRLFDKITSSMSDKELLEAALRKAENMNNEKKRISIKKPIVIACAAVAVLACGVTAAAVTGLLDFDTLFGNKIIAESEELGYELIGDAHDVVITCSDNNYNVVLNGVTGNANTIIASVEISSKDGTPMSELHSDEHVMPDFSDIKVSYDSSEAQPLPLGMGYNSEYTETGSVLYTCYISVDKYDFSTAEGIAGKRICFGFYDFGFSADREGFDFQVEFTYYPSEKSLERLSAADVSAQCDILYNIICRMETEQNDIHVGDDIPIKTNITAIDIRPNQGMLHGGFDLGEYTWDGYTMSTFRSNNKVTLVRIDGTEIPVDLGGYQMNNEDGYVTFSMDLKYRERDDITETAIDLSTVKSLSINGTEYILS